jgi:polyisoprenoid-binding protein YceI
MPALQTETATLIPAGTWAVDPVHSSIRWDVIDLDAGMKSVSGRFTEFEGTVEGGEEQAAKGVVRTASLLTDHEMRDNHLRSSDMLDTDRFPEIRFESSRVDQVDGNRL